MVYDLESMPTSQDDIELEFNPGSADDIEPIAPEISHQPGASVFARVRLHQGTDLFDVLKTTDRSQLAVMALQNGQTSGPFGTDHPKADQVFCVLEGTGQLVLDTGDIEVHAGDCGVIEAGTRHQFAGKGEHVFRTLNVYAPVAYPEERED
jgi:mannose-6-phosphate isomerase-like protein (cupin superfamily)